MDVNEFPNWINDRFGLDFTSKSIAETNNGRVLLFDPKRQVFWKEGNNKEEVFADSRKFKIDNWISEFHLLNATAISSVGSFERFKHSMTQSIQEIVLSSGYVAYLIVFIVGIVLSFFINMWYKRFKHSKAEAQNSYRKLI